MGLNPQCNFMDETDDSPLRSLAERDINIVQQRQQASPKREETPRHVRKERLVKKLHERMSADSRLSYRMADSGNTGSPVLNKEDEPEKKEEIKVESQFDCTPDVELPGLDTDDENDRAEVEQLDWKNPQNKAKFEKHNKRRRSRLFDGSPAMSPVMKRQRNNGKLEVMVTSTPSRSLATPIVDSFDDSFDNAPPTSSTAATTITAKDKTIENATDDFTDDSLFEQLATQYQAPPSSPPQQIEQKTKPHVESRHDSQDGNGTDDFDDDTFMEEHARQLAASQIPKPNFESNEKTVVKHKEPQVVNQFA